MNKCWLLIQCMLLIVYHASSAEGGNITLTVNITGGTPNTGTAILSLFASAENFLKQPIQKASKPIGKHGKAVFIIHSLERGTYAISVVYDQDNNGKLNTGFLGIPTERVGFSNNAMSIFGPPSFDKAAFEVNDSSELNIQLKQARE